MAYQVSREGTIYQNGRVIGRTNNPQQVARRLRGSRKRHRPVPAPQEKAA